MDYTKHYNNLIAKCRIRNWTKKTATEYVERHHIVPKCLKGDNSKENLIYLTAKEHFVAHLLLWKIYGGSLVYAAWAMTHQFGSILTGNEQKRHYKVNSTLYAKLKTESSKITGERLKKSNTGRKQTEEHKRNKTNAFLDSIETGRYIPHGGTKTAEHKNKISESRKRNNESWLSEETKEKIRKTLLSSPRLVCPHCNKIGAASNMKRWHFANCKSIL
jgi:hypothetical protein